MQGPTGQSVVTALITAAAAMTLLGIDRASATSPAGKCEAVTLKIAGKHEFCRVKAESKAAKSSGSSDEPTRDAVAFRSMEGADAPGLVKKSGGPLLDHGGPVLDSSTTYAIYWGPPSKFPADLESGMETLLSGFDGSSYLGIADQYLHGAPVSTEYAGAVSDTSAPPSKPPRTADIGAEVCKLFPAPDPAGLYIVFTSNAPNINYCAWHADATCNGVTFQIAYIPNQALLPACSPYTKVDLRCNAYSPGTVTSADSVAHEFMETITDPNLNAWYDRNGQEIADKCNYNYQGCVELSNVSTWQIQSEWSNAIGACQQQ